MKNKKASPGVAYGYVRASTEEQRETLHAQLARLDAAYEQKLAPRGFARGEVMVDAGVSGGKAIRDRPNGYRLCLALMPGDILVIPAVDRAFRDMADLCKETQEWTKRGIGLMILNFDIDTSTPMGKAALQMNGVFAEFERSMTSQRQKEWWESRRRRGQPAGRYPPFGFKKVGRKGATSYAPCEKSRDLGARIVALVDGKRMSYREAVAALLGEGVVNPNTGEPPGLDTVCRFHKAELALREKEAKSQAKPSAN